jgi:hypothetical protein
MAFIYFMVYFMALSVTQDYTVSNGNITGEVEGMWKEAVVA